MKLFKKYVKEKIDKTVKLYNNLQKIETLKFLIEKDIPKYIDMLNKGDKTLMRFLQRHCLLDNYPNDNWINFAKCFFDRHVEPVYINSFKHSFGIYYNIITHDINIQDIINDFNKLPKNKQYRLWVSFDIYLETLKDIIDPYNLDLSQPEIIRSFHQIEYVVKGRIISSI